MQTMTIVPIAPTDAMIEAGGKVLPLHGEYRQIYAKQVWTTMASRAPCLQNDKAPMSEDEVAVILNKWRADDGTPTDLIRLVESVHGIFSPVNT